MLSVRLYFHSPNREFLSGICNILRRSELSHRNNNNNRTVFAVSTWGEAATAALKHLGGRQHLASPFMSWKSQAIQMAPLKHCDGSPQRVGDCVGLCPDMAAAPPSLLLLKIPLWLFWRARPWQSARLQNPAPPFEQCSWVSVAKHRFPLGVEIRDAVEGKLWCFQMLFCLLVKQCL